MTRRGTAARRQQRNPPEGTSPGVTRRRAETRQRLVDAAYDVFTEYSIRDAPTELICDRAGFTRGAFYSNFASKEDLFLAVFDQQLSQRVEELRTTVADMLSDVAVDNVDSLREVIARVSAAYLEPLVTDPTWYLMAVEFKAIALRDPELFADVRESVTRLDRELAEVLASLFDQVGIELAMPIEDAATVLAGLYEMAVERVVFDQVRTPLESPFITEVLPRLLTDSLLNPTRSSQSSVAAHQPPGHGEQ